MSASSYTDQKKSALLRKAAYWLEDYARAFRTVPEGQKLYKQLRKIAADCRRAGVQKRTEMDGQRASR